MLSLSTIDPIDGVGVLAHLFSETAQIPLQLLYEMFLVLHDLTHAPEFGTH